MLKPAPIFSNHMVLQRNKRIAIWGKAGQEKVTVSLNGSAVTAEGKDGSFFAELPPMAEGGPYCMEITDGTETVTFEDVMVGEVWLAGGQSNMELELQNSFEGEKELERIQPSNVRYYYVPKVAYFCDELLEEEEKSTWECAGKEEAAKWSAVAYYFAKEVSEKLGVAVGIIGCNWGGTSASCWTGRKMMEQNKVISSYIEEYDKIVENQTLEEYIKEREEYVVYQAEFDRKVANYYQTCEHPTWVEAISLFGENKYPEPMEPYSECRPSGLYEVMLSRVCPYSLRGFLYYQGEEDDHKPDVYYELLSALIKQWRMDWKEDSLPFLLVQLPVFQNEGEVDYKNWPLIREAQMRAYQTIKNTGIAVILEQGEFGNIHPTKKDIVGKRLALQAFFHVYCLCGEKEAFGPVYRDYFAEGGKMTLLFDHCDGGFVQDGKVQGFELAGSDKKYYPADFTIEGERIILSSDEVDLPKYARYCWTNYQEIALFGKNGIPLAPFRTSYGDGSRMIGSRNLPE